MRRFAFSCDVPTRTESPIDVIINHLREMIFKHNAYMYGVESVPKIEIFYEGENFHDIYLVNRAKITSRNSWGEIFNDTPRGAEKFFPRY